VVSRIRETFDKICLMFLHGHKEKVIKKKLILFAKAIFDFHTF